MGDAGSLGKAASSRLRVRASGEGVGRTAGAKKCKLVVLREHAGVLSL